MLALSLSSRVSCAVARMGTAVRKTPTFYYSFMNRDESFSASLLYFLAPIRDLLEDPNVTEVMVNGPEEVFVERGGRLFSTDRSFSSDDALRSAVHNIAQYVGREI